MARTARGLLALCTAALLAGCTSGGSASEDPLAHYTDDGDGCQQVVSAISYADESLKPLGQERYQTWSDEVRSRLAAVAGTVALEVYDFPSKDALGAARRAARYAERSSAARVPGDRRARYLRSYRREAASVVLTCAHDVANL